MKETFGDRIKRLRREKNLSQEGLATESGLSASLVRRWEKNQIEDINRTKLDALAKILGVSSPYLLYGAVEIDGLPDEAIGWLVNWLKTDDGKQSVKDWYKDARLKAMSSEFDKL